MIYDKRRTYISEAGTYDLDPAKTMGVIADIHKYLDRAGDQERADNPSFSEAFFGLDGQSRQLRIYSGEIVGTEFGSFSLAELVASDDFSELTLKINAHTESGIPTDGLHTIGRRYAQ